MTQYLVEEALDVALELHEAALEARIAEQLDNDRALHRAQAETAAGVAAAERAAR